MNDRAGTYLGSAAESLVALVSRTQDSGGEAPERTTIRADEIVWKTLTHIARCTRERDAREPIMLLLVEEILVPYGESSEETA